MTTTRALLMSRPTEEGPARRPVRLSRTWSTAFGDGVSLALVGVAAVGSVVETLDMPTDDVRGVLEVGGGALAGTVAALVYGRLETRADRAARVRAFAWSIFRFFVAFELMRYGAAKLVGMQFYPRYYRLDMRPADMTPMALAWTFFGRSYGYQAVSGAFEIAAAVLLCFRRTASLGACVLLPVMANIVLLDVFYDVPVKLFSSIYLGMGVWILAPEARRFWAFFLGDGPIPPRIGFPAVSARPRARIATAFVVALVLVLPCADIVHKAAQRGIFHDDPLEGAWAVERQAGLDSLLGVPGTWERIYFEKGAYGFVRVGGARVPFKTDVDEASRTVRLFEIGDPATCRGTDARTLAGSFEIEGRRLYIRGSRDGAPFSLDLTRDLPR